MKKDMASSITIDGYTFEYDESANPYDCRGDVCYDDEHDEVPEDGLWTAAMKLEKRLSAEGHNADAQPSEKGWVEVSIY